MFFKVLQIISSSPGVVSVRYQRTASGNVTVLAQRKTTADGTTKPTNGMTRDDAAVKVKALLKCSTGKGEGIPYHSHHNGNTMNGMY